VLAGGFADSVRTQHGLSMGYPRRTIEHLASIPEFKSVTGNGHGFRLESGTTIPAPGVSHFLYLTIPLRHAILARGASHSDQPVGRQDIAMPATRGGWQSLRFRVQSYKPRCEVPGNIAATRDPEP